MQVEVTGDIGSAGYAGAVQQNVYVRLRFVIEEAEQLLGAMTRHRNWPAFVREHGGWQARATVQRNTIESLRRTLPPGYSDLPEHVFSEGPSPEEVALLQTAEDVRYRLALGYAQVDAFPRDAPWMTW